LGYYPAISSAQHTGTDSGFNDSCGQEQVPILPIKNTTNTPAGLQHSKKEKLLLEIL
jgi:hypothetical protein